MGRVGPRNLPVSRAEQVGDRVLGEILLLVFRAFIGMLYVVRAIVPLGVVYALWQILGQ